MNKKTWTRLVSLTLAAALLMPALTACGKTEDKALVVRYLNFKPEIADKYQELAKRYEQETGVKVVVETAANNTYEQTLAAKMATGEAPTLFQINGPRGYAAWKDYCADLSGTELYKHLADKNMAIKDGDKVVGYVGSQTVIDESDMMNIAVHPECRRCGIAEKLIDALVNALGEKGSRGLSLEVRASNAPAIALYQKMGFSQVGRRPNYYRNPREDALILRKEWKK